MHEVPAVTYMGCHRYRAHPAFGLVPSVGERLASLSDRQLGDQWNALSDEQKEEREASFFHRVLVFLLGLGPLRFEADIPMPDDRQRLEENAGDEADIVVFKTVCTGRMTPGVGAMLLTTQPVEMEIRWNGEPVLRMHDGWSGVEVCLNRQHAVELAAELRRHGFTTPDPI